jgi:hypothetical protein
MLRGVALVKTDVSEKSRASIIRVTGFGEIGKTLAITSNRRKPWRNTVWKSQILLLILCSMQPPVVRFYVPPEYKSWSAVIRGPALRRYTANTELINTAISLLIRMLYVCLCCSKLLLVLWLSEGTSWSRLQCLLWLNSFHRIVMAFMWRNIQLYMANKKCRQTIMGKKSVGKGPLCMQRNCEVILCESVIHFSQIRRRIKNAVVHNVIPYGSC